MSSQRENIVLFTRGVMDRIRDHIEETEGNIFEGGE